MTKIKLGIYQHFKGKFYKIIGVGRRSETLEEFVIYQALYNSKKFGKNSLWIRPKKEFFENITIKRKKIPRFKFISKL